MKWISVKDESKKDGYFGWLSGSDIYAFILSFISVISIYCISSSSDEFVSLLGGFFLTEIQQLVIVVVLSIIVVPSSLICFVGWTSPKLGRAHKHACFSVTGICLVFSGAGLALTPISLIWAISGESTFLIPVMSFFVFLQFLGGAYCLKLLVPVCYRVNRMFCSEW